MIQDANGSKTMQELSLDDVVDIKTLLDEMRKQPSIYARYAMGYEKIKSEVNSLKLNLKILESEIARKIREIDAKCSEAKIERMLFENAEYIEAHKALNQLREKEGHFNAIVRTLEQKHSLMLTMSAIMKEEMKQLNVPTKG
jgi:hypothetical protein